MMPVEISAALLAFVNVETKHVVQGTLRPKENLRLIVACIRVGTDFQAHNETNNAKNRCTWCVSGLQEIFETEKR